MIYSCMSVRCITKATHWYACAQKVQPLHIFWNIAYLSLWLLMRSVFKLVALFFTKNHSNETNCRRVLLATFVSLCLLPCAHRYVWRAGSLGSLFHIPFWTLDRVSVCRAANPLTSKRGATYDKKRSKKSKRGATFDKKRSKKRSKTIT